MNWRADWERQKALLKKIFGRSWEFKGEQETDVPLPKLDKQISDLEKWCKAEEERLNGGAE